MEEGLAELSRRGVRGILAPTPLEFLFGFFLYCVLVLRPLLMCPTGGERPNTTHNQHRCCCEGFWKSHQAVCQDSVQFSVF